MTTVRQAFLNAIDGIAYLVDADGVIVGVGDPAWDEALRRYEVEPEGRRPIVGASLFDAMNGPEVRAIYQGLHRSVLAGERPYIAFEMRCDAPDVRRFLRMSITALHEPDAPPMALYQSQVLSAVPRPWVSLFDPQKIIDHIHLDTALSIVKLCSFCHRVAWPIEAPREWLPSEDYYRRGGPVDVRTSHGVCPACADRIARHQDEGGQVPRLGCAPAPVPA